MGLFLYPYAPDLLLASVAILLLMFGAFFKSKRALRGIYAISFALIIFLLMLFISDIPLSIRTTPLDPHFILSEYIQMGKMLVLGAAGLTLLLAWQWTNAKHSAVQAKAEYPVIVLFSSLGLMLMLSANSLLALYVALELASLSMYVMASYERDNLVSSEAGLKYFVLGSLASGMLLFGISLIYGFTGTVSLEAISELLAADTPINLGLITGLVFVLVAFCFKISAVPFHMWTPDVYQGAPTAVVAFFATAPKVAMLCLLARLLHGAFEQMAPFWAQVIVAAAALSMVIGAVGALVQTKVKRIIAYSSIGHIGYVLMAVLAGTQQGIEAMLIYLIIYVSMSVGLFACLMMLSVDGKELADIAQLRGLSTSHPKMAAILAVLMFSLAGIPPFIGFFAKMFVFTAALQAGYVSLVVLAAISSVIACFYYIRIVKVMYFDEQIDVPDITKPFSPAGMVVLVSLLANALILAPSFFIQPARDAALIVFP